MESNTAASLPAKQWFESISFHAEDAPGPLAIGAPSQVMSPSVDTLNKNTAGAITAADNSVHITEQVQGEPRRYRPGEDGAQLAEDLQRRTAMTSLPSSTSPIDFTSVLSNTSPRTTAAAKAAASLHSERSSPPAISVVDLPDTPRRKRGQDVLPDPLPLPAANRRSGSLPPILVRPHLKTKL